MASRHSRFKLPMHDSATGLAIGDWCGALTTSSPAWRKVGVESLRELAVPIPDQEAQVQALVLEPS